MGESTIRGAGARPARTSDARAGLQIDTGVDADADATRILTSKPKPAACLEVLSAGFQRRRIAAGEHLRLLTPGTLLSNTAAPTRRQQRLLRLPAR
jgi:hypothetical protein